MNMKQSSIFKSAIFGCLLTIIAGGFPSCQTDGEYAGWTERTTPLRAEFIYVADTAARFAVEYDGMELADTLPYRTMWGQNEILVLQGRGLAFLSENRMKGLLRVYRLENGERILDMEEDINISPVVVTGGNAGSRGYLGVYSAVNLAQLVAGAPVQTVQTPELPADSTAIALQFFYADDRQPDEVRISFLTVDQYSVLMKSYKLENVADSMKADAGEIALHRGELSETLTFDLNHFGEANKGLAAKFYYRVSDRDGNILQDYKAASAATNSIEIKPEATQRNKIPVPVYKSALMQWEYRSEAMPFASPKVLINGEKW
jgi:hypothetical protein